MRAPLILLASVLALSRACDVCNGLSLHQEPATDILLPPSGDLSSCDCDFVFAYSSGPTPGKVTLSATMGVGRITVYSDALGSTKIVELPGSSLVDDVVVFSETGTIRVSISTVRFPSASSSISISSTAVNTAPTIEEREGLEFFESFVDVLLVPWGSAFPSPVTIRDYDNNELGLRAEIALITGSSLEIETLEFSVPFVAGVTYEAGGPDTRLRRVEVRGPGSAVEEVVNNLLLHPIALGVRDDDQFIVRLNDLGNSGEGGSLVSNYETQVGSYPVGLVDVPRGSGWLNSGSEIPTTGTTATFVVHDAYEVAFVALELDVGDQSCVEYVRVWDGSDPATARLLSLSLFPTGEICGEANEFLPTYTGTTGSFFVEYLAVDGYAPFNTEVSNTPVGFRTWVLGETTEFQVAINSNALLLPQLMVTSLPDPADIAVNITATEGIMTLRFADSFGDLVRTSDDTLLSLSLAEPLAMLRMGDVLREIQFAATEPGTAVIRVEAWSGGVAADPVEIVVEAVAVAINAPETLTLNAFQPVPIPVSVDASGVVAATVTVLSGLGLVSLDPRAALWVEAGYASSVTTSGTVAEVNEALSTLVYKATEGGGRETLLLRVGSIERRVEMLVDADCSGSHFVYGREGGITERAGALSDRHAADLECTWFIIGARELQFPFFELPTFGTAFLVNDNSQTLFVYTFSDPGTIRSPEEPFFLVYFDAISSSSEGFAATFSPVASINDPPIILVPEGLIRVVRGSTTRLRTLYVNDFTDGAIEASLTTNAGSLQQEGTRSIEITAADFDELDAWITSIDFLAGDVQTTATLTLTATDGGGAEAVAEFSIVILACSGIVEVTLDDGSTSVTVEDGSGTADYVDGVACGWRLTGAPGPAALDVTFLDLDCVGDSVTIYDGSSPAGAQLGSFCQAEQLAAQIGTLVSSTGSFFVSLVSNGDGLLGDGFSFEYGAVAAGAVTDLGAAPQSTDPVRLDATVVALDADSVLVFGGHNGVRAVSSTLLFDGADRWRVLVGDGPAGRSRAAGAAIDASQIVVHGGDDIGDDVLAQPWVGVIDGDTITWTQLPESGPTTNAAAMHVHNGEAYLVDVSGLWLLTDNSWALVGTTPPAVVPTTSAYRPADGLVYAVAGDGAVWSLSLATRVWTPLDASLEVSCAAWTCSGAMLGADEYAVGDSRVNVTSLAVDLLPAPITGQAVGGQYLGQPSLFVYEAGAMTTIPLTLDVSSHLPMVSPSSGGTMITLTGEQLSTCPTPRCQIGASLQPVQVSSERVASCVTPAGSELSAVTLVCADGRRYTSPDPLVFFSEPTIEGLEPLMPDPGDLVLVRLGGVSADVVALVNAPLCRFDGETIAATVSDGTTLECRVPTSLRAGTTATLEVSLDGQQFAAGTGVELASASSSLSSSIILIIALVSTAAFVIFVAVVIRYKRIAARIASGPAPWEIDFSAIELYNVIGTGGYGSVHRGRFRGGEVAVKVTKATEMSPEVIDSFRKESALMAELRHPNIVLFMGACTKPPNIAIVLEFMPNGSLFDLLHDEAIVLRSRQRLSFAMDIVKGMAYLHAADPPIIHHDLKSLNALVDKSWNLKVSDFGLTEIFQGGGGGGGGGSRTDSGGSSAACGSLYWSAPEVLQGDIGDTSSDVYSFGVTLWEIATREIPYEGLPILAVASRVPSREQLRPTTAGGGSAHRPMQKLINECWAADPAKRPTFAQLQTRLADFGPVDEGSTAGTTLDSNIPSLASNADEIAVCVVMFRGVGTASLWEEDPANARRVMAGFAADAERLCKENRGFMVPGSEEQTMAGFGAVADGIAYAMAMQQSPSASVVSIAGALGAGDARMRTDPMSRRSYLVGAGVEEALLMLSDSAGGQVLARRGVTDGLEMKIGIKDFDDGRVVLYPDQRVEAVRPVDLGSNSSNKQMDPSWVIKSSELEIGTLIGAGSYGTVFKATWRGTPVAAKQLHRKKLAAKESLDLQMESGIASKLRHPNVCLVMGICKDAEAGKVYVVSEYMSKGSLYEAIVAERKPIAVDIKTKVAKDIALGLRYLHGQDPVVVHRSLTARNVLLGDGWTAKISDFGLARLKDGGATMTKVGSTAYGAPEVIKGERYAEKADVYAYGVLVWEMVAQDSAWGGLRLGTVVESVLGGKRPHIRAEWRTNEDKTLIEVAERCWKQEAEDRPEMGEVHRMLGGD